MGEAMSVEEAEEIIGYVDKNGDGKIDIDEFIIMMLKCIADEEELDAEDDWQRIFSRKYLVNSFHTELVKSRKVKEGNFPLIGIIGDVSDHMYPASYLQICLCQA